MAFGNYVMLRSRFSSVCYVGQNPEENNGLCLWEEPEDEND